MNLDDEFQCIFECIAPISDEEKAEMLLRYFTFAALQARSAELKARHDELKAHYEEERSFYEEAASVAMEARARRADARARLKSLTYQFGGFPPAGGGHLSNR